MNSEWYEIWFDTHFYHVLYGNRDEAEARAFLDVLMKQLELPLGSNILDMACGKGRHSIYLNECGYQVTGIDLSANSIAEANRSRKSGLDFHVHDIRKTFRERHFDLALNLFTSFGYGRDPNDNFKAIEQMGRNLKPGGYFVLDYLNAHQSIQCLMDKEQKKIGDLKFDICRWVDGGKLHKEIKVSDQERVHQFKEEVQLLDLGHFSAYFEEAGLELMDHFGNYHLDPFNENSSDRLILIAKKNAA